MALVIGPSHKRPNSRRFPQCTRTQKCHRLEVDVSEQQWISPEREFGTVNRRVTWTPTCARGVWEDQTILSLSLSPNSIFSVSMGMESH